MLLAKSATSARADARYRRSSSVGDRLFYSPPRPSSFSSQHTQTVEETVRIHGHFYAVSCELVISTSLPRGSPVSTAASSTAGPVTWCRDPCDRAVGWGFVARFHARLSGPRLNLARPDEAATAFATRRPTPMGAPMRGYGKVRPAKAKR
jgi:hypothetical protein